MLRGIGSDTAAKGRCEELSEAVNELLALHEQHALAAAAAAAPAVSEASWLEGDPMPAQLAAWGCSEELWDRVKDKKALVRLAAVASEARGRRRIERLKLTVRASLGLSAVQPVEPRAAVRACPCPPQCPSCPCLARSVPVARRALRRQLTLRRRTFRLRRALRRRAPLGASMHLARGALPSCRWRTGVASRHLARCEPRTARNGREAHRKFDQTTGRARAAAPTSLHRRSHATGAAHLGGVPV